MKGRIALIALLLGHTVQTASAQALPSPSRRIECPTPACLPENSTAGSFLKAYNTYSTLSLMRAHIDIILNAYFDAFSWYNTSLVGAQQPQLYCPPLTLALAPSQLIDMIERQVSEHPLLGNFPVGVVTLMGLEKTFPCKGSPTQPKDLRR
jgi:hypothetical protein